MKNQLHTEDETLETAVEEVPTEEGGGPLIPKDPIKKP